MDWNLTDIKVEILSEQESDNMGCTCDYINCITCAHCLAQFADDKALMFAGKNIFEVYSSFMSKQVMNPPDQLEALAQTLSRPDPDGPPDGFFGNERKWKESDAIYEKQMRDHKNSSAVLHIHRAWNWTSIRDDLRMGVNYAAERETD